MPGSNVQLRYIVSVISIVNTLLIIMNIYANNRNNVVVVVVVVFGGGWGVGCYLSLIGPHVSSP